MYNAWDAHYRQVNVLRFSHDGATLLSGSEDSGASVWSMSRLTRFTSRILVCPSHNLLPHRLLDDDLQNDLPTPYCTFSDHTLPVTDIICGIGQFPSYRVLTASLDHSAKVGFHYFLSIFLHLRRCASCGTCPRNRSSQRSTSLSRSHVWHGIGQSACSLLHLRTARYTK